MPPGTESSSDPPSGRPTRARKAPNRMNMAVMGRDPIDVPVNAVSASGRVNDEDLPPPLAPPKPRKAQQAKTAATKPTKTKATPTALLPVADIPPIPPTVHKYLQPNPPLVTALSDDVPVQRTVPIIHAQQVPQNITSLPSVNGNNIPSNPVHTNHGLPPPNSHALPITNANASNIIPRLPTKRQQQTFFSQHSISQPLLPNSGEHHTLRRVVSDTIPEHGDCPPSPHPPVNYDGDVGPGHSFDTDDIYGSDDGIQPSSTGLRYDSPFNDWNSSPIHTPPHSPEPRESLPSRGLDNNRPAIQQPHRAPSRDRPFQLEHRSRHQRLPPRSPESETIFIPPDNGSDSDNEADTYTPAVGDSTARPSNVRDSTIDIDHFVIRGDVKTGRRAACCFCEYVPISVYYLRNSNTMSRKTFAPTTSGGNLCTHARTFHEKEYIAFCSVHCPARLGVAPTSQLRTGRPTERVPFSQKELVRHLLRFIVADDQVCFPFLVL